MILWRAQNDKKKGGGTLAIHGNDGIDTLSLRERYPHHRVGDVMLVMWVPAYVGRRFQRQP